MINTPTGIYMIFFCRLDIFIFHVRYVQRRYRDTADTQRAGGARGVTKIHVVCDWNEHVQKKIASPQLAVEPLLSVFYLISLLIRAADDSVCIFNSNASISRLFVATSYNSNNIRLVLWCGQYIGYMLVRSWCGNEVIQNIVLKMWGLNALQCFPNALVRHQNMKVTEKKF